MPEEYHEIRQQILVLSAAGVDPEVADHEHEVHADHVATEAEEERLSE